MSEIVTQARDWPVIGHGHHVARLRRIIARGQYPLALLITGAPQVGRKTLALHFAAAALCPNSTDGVACNNCSTCSRISSGSHPDVEIWSIDRQEREDGASKSAALTIETIRKVSASTALRPHQADRRFIIVDDAETLGEAAQQAMLKTLEDLPAFATIVLIATSANSMLETVRSRCNEIPLQLVPTEIISAHLDHPDRAAIAAGAGGRPGWAIRAMENPEWLSQQVASIDELTAWMRLPTVDRLIEAYVRGDRFSRDRRRSLDDLDRIQMIWRDAALASSDATKFAFDPVRAQSLIAGTGARLNDIHRAMRATRQCMRDLNGNIRPRLAMQAMVNQWPTL